MNQYGAGQNVPYSGQQEADLVSNPRYTGQSAGTNPLGHDGRGPAEESRYGAAPLSTNAGTNTGLGAQNTSNVWPSPAAPPHARRSDLAGVDQYGNPRREGVVDRMKDAVGMGPHSGTTGYDSRRDQPGHGTPGYDNYGQPRKEGMVGRMEDAAGVGPHSGARGPYTGEERGFGGGLGHPTGTTTGYDQSGLGSGLGTHHHDHHHDGVHVVPGTIPLVGTGERRVEPGYDASRGQFGHRHQSTTTGSPRKEGIVEKIKDAVGMGKHDNVAHTHPGAPTGTTLPNTYGTGESGLGHHGNAAATYGSTPGSYSHNSMVDTGLGHERHPGSGTGYPHETVGDRVKDAVGAPHHDAAGYPHNTTAGAYPGSTTGYPHETMGDKMKDAAGVGPHHGVTGTDYDYERTGKGFEDTTGPMHHTRTGPGFDATNVDHPRTGAGYDDTNVDYPHNDAAAYGAGGAPPKKGMMTKIKEKLHQ